MFESREHYEWDVPAPMREPGVSYWRTVTLAWTMPWFLMVIRWSAEDAIQSFLISNDRDLVSALRSIQGRGVLEFLACCRPEIQERGLVWSMRDIQEVWLGGDVSQHAFHTVLVDLERRCITGSSCEFVSDVTLTHLVARVGDVVHSSLPADDVCRQGT